MRPSPSDPATWDRHAARYGRQEHLEAAATDTLLRLAAPLPGEHLVDVGTGTGLVLRTLAARDDRPRRATGFDRSARMLEQTGPLPAGWAVVQAPADDIPLADGSADVITCAYVLHLLAPRERADVLGELRRLLAPGGRLVLSTTWSSRPATRRALAAVALTAPARLGGLRPLNPAGDLRRAGFAPGRSAFVRHGYPTLVVRATLG